MNKNMSALLIILIGVLVLVLFMHTKREAAQERSSADWLSVDGMVSSSEVKRHWDKNNGAPTTRFSFHINYNYKVNDQTYVGHRYQFHGDPVFKSQTEAEKLKADYTTGKTIKVYYDSNNPQQSVLTR